MPERQGDTRRLIGFAARSSGGDEILLVGDRRCGLEISERLGRRINRYGSTQVRSRRRINKERKVAAVAGPIIGRSRSEESPVLCELSIGKVVGVVLVERRHEKVRDVSRCRFRSTSLHGYTEIDRVAIVDARRFILRARCHGKSRHDH